MSRRRSKLAALLLGATPVLLLGALAQPAQASGVFFAMHRCTADNPRRAQDALQACGQVIDDSHASMSQIRRALGVRGALRAARGDLTGAGNDLQRAIDLGDTNARTYLALGRVQARLNDPAALATLTTARRNADADSPLQFDIGVALGELYLDRHAWSEAGYAYASAALHAEGDAQHATALIGSGHAKFGAGALNDAIADYTAARDADENSAPALLALADALSLRADRQRDNADVIAASAAYERALSLAPTSENAATRILRTRAFTGRGDLYLARFHRQHASADLDQASQDFDAAISIDGQNIAALTGRAAVFAQAENGLQRAIADLDRALRVNPANPDLYRLRGDLFADLGDPERAMRDYDASLQNGGVNSYDTYFRRGGVYLDLGDYHRAEQSFAHAVSLAEGGYLPPGADGAASTAAALAMRARAIWGLIDEPGANAQQIALRALTYADQAAALQPAQPKLVAGRCLSRTVGGGQWAIAEGACHDAITLARHTGDPTDLGYALGAMGLLQLRWALAGSNNGGEEQQRLNIAAVYLHDAISADPANAANQTALHQYAQGVVLECLGRQGEASRMMRDALNADRAVAAHFEAHRIRRCHA